MATLHVYSIQCLRFLEPMKTMAFAAYRPPIIYPSLAPPLAVSAARASYPCRERASSLQGEHTTLAGVVPEWFVHKE